MILVFYGIWEYFSNLINNRIIEESHKEKIELFNLIEIINCFNYLEIMREMS